MPPAEEEEPPSTAASRSSGATGRNFPVVAVGASAGGLEAFTALLRRLPAQTGMAFVFIQHLDPTHESRLAQLLSRETVMPVTFAEDGEVLSPNRVYVIPPNTTMTISGLTLTLGPRAAAATAVDSFLRSLALSQQERAIAVILSGTGSDGTLGVQAISEEGGIVLVQAPQTAKFDGMPRSAVATGCADFVLPPEGIAAELARIAAEPHLVSRGIPNLEPHFPHSEKDFRAVLDLIREHTGIDFSRYRQTTVKRRLLRRLGLLRRKDLGDYLRHLKENPEEAQSLAQDILIRVTRFFRDPEGFEALSTHVFPALIRSTPPGQPVRIWVPGCSSGEEAYSIAISFLETAEQLQSRVPVQVFATDVNESAIEKARRGRYPENIAGDISQERLSRFFVRTGREHQVSRRLRDACIFSRHDLLNDPPLARMDLISCRNLLIYLESVQEDVFLRFHFALNPGGFLLLGKSESAASFPELFAPVDKKARLYVRQECARYPAPAYGDAKEEVLAREPRFGRRLDLCAQADRILVERYGPPRVVVNRDLDPVGHAGVRTPSSGMESGKILDELRKTRAEELKNAVRTASETGESIRIGELRLGEGSFSEEFSVEVTPLEPERDHFLIVFERRGEMDLPAGSAGQADIRKYESRIAHLQRQLASSRTHLESVISEHEAANEEVVAPNEELQSLNQELESSKEELEAANEELTTINQELQVRNAELDRAREFAEATIDTVRGPLAVLGPDLRVLRVNPAFYRVFGLEPDAVKDRYLYELGNGQFNVPRLRAMLEEALPQNRVIEDYELEYEAPSAGRRVLLLNARRFEREDRILLAIEDVTEKKRIEEELRYVQKMEAIGYLASGIAHDFNNLLTGVIGSASLVLESLADDDFHRPTLEGIISAGERAAQLTQQLLAYAGKGRFYLERLDLSEEVVKACRLIHVSIPHNVQLRLYLDSHLPLLLADRSQLQQVVTNLIINAVEATGSGGGIVEVRTGRQAVTGERLPDLTPGQKVVPGEFVFLEVVDNGPGMDEETKRKIFDPFFTTKFTGRGLGLAAVLGIVRQHRGIVQVRSAPGRGTSFRVLFCVDETVHASLPEDLSREDLQGAGTVLVVDDEELIRNFSKAALEQYGYRVLLAKDGQEALELMRQESENIRVVLFDAEIPDTDELETLAGIRRIMPDIPLIICSGLGEVPHERYAGQAVEFLTKPFTVRQLARKVKETIKPEPPAGPAQS
ncbi:MAG TPA: chemotaxis protein CheB [Bryobacteraceae bacterium]|nr:chemotaxis protein CheB [Bryobacteraceae bacterium]HPU72741.1 chemotaxis protein CheB [Bryobacteraceae bacterium]